MILDENVELDHLPREQVYNKMVVQRNNIYYVLNENYVDVMATLSSALLF